MKQSTNRHALNKIWDRMYPQLVGKDYRDDERNRQVSVSVMHKTLFDLMNCEIWNEYLMSTNVRDDDFLFNEKKAQTDEACRTTLKRDFLESRRGHFVRRKNVIISATQLLWDALEAFDQLRTLEHLTRKFIHSALKY